MNFKVVIRKKRIHLIAANGEQLAVSEAYFSTWNAKRAASKMFPNVEPVVEK